MLPLVASDLDLCLLFVHTVTALSGVVLCSLQVFILDQESLTGHFSKRDDSSLGGPESSKSTLDN